MKIKTIIIIISLLVSAGVIWQLILPNYQEIKEKRIEASQKKQELEKLENLTRKLDQLSKAYQEKEKEIEKVFAILPKKEDLAGLLVQFESLSASSGLILNSIDFSAVEVSEQEAVKWQTEKTETEKKAKPPYKTLALNLKLTGSYESFEKFLTNLENNLRLTDIGSISFSSKGETGDIFDFSLFANVYFQ